MLSLASSEDCTATLPSGGIWGRNETEKLLVGINPRKGWEKRGGRAEARLKSFLTCDQF